MKGYWSLCLLSLLSIASASAADSLMVAEGEVLFSQTCKACHQLEQRLVGPPLKGVDKRHTEEWILKFVKSSQTMVLAGDSAAVALFNTYNKVVMPDHTFTENQIRSILAYIKDAETPRGVVTGAIPRPVVTTAASPARPLKFSDYRFWILYTVTVVLVIVSIYYKAELIALRKKVEHLE